MVPSLLHRFPPNYCYYILLKFWQLVFQLPKLLWNIRDIVRFYCITTGSNNSNMISIILINIWIVLNKIIINLKKFDWLKFFQIFLYRFGENKNHLCLIPLRFWQSDGRLGGGLDNVEYGIFFLWISPKNLNCCMFSIFFLIKNLWFYW